MYSHPQTDCFVVLQLFSASRRVGNLNLRSKPAQLYVRLSEPRQLGNYKALCSRFRLFTFYTLPDIRALNSFEELCIMRVAAINSFARVLNPRRVAYVVIHRLTVSSYHNSPVWVDTKGTWSWDRKPANFTLD